MGSLILQIEPLQQLSSGPYPCCYRYTYTLISYDCGKSSLRAHCVPATALGFRESAAKKTNPASGACCLENGKTKETIYKFMSLLLSVMKNEQNKLRMG